MSDVAQPRNPLRQVAQQIWAHHGDQTVVLPLCGGNIDPLVLRRVIQYGMAADHRLFRLHLTISDRPGGLAALTRHISDTGVSIQDIRHERIFAGSNVANVDVYIVAETRNAQHQEQLRQHLLSHGYEISSQPES